jgi:hypothetical protein
LLDVAAMQLEQLALLTLTLTPETAVTPLELRLKNKLEELHAYAPIYRTLIDPPYEFAPKETSWLKEAAVQSDQPELLTLTLTPDTLVASLALRLMVCKEKLHAYAPIYSTLIDPPYEFEPPEKL